jgi:uncharacterized membrane protein
MALDHVREFFSYTSFRATDVSQTSVFLFFTRWITHLCAPTFVFLSGISIYLYFTKAADLKKTSTFLATRGLWLIVVEVFIVSFILTQGYQLTLLEVIWTIGCSMILLAGLIWLPRSIQLALSLIMIVAHNALPPIGEVTPGNVVFAFLHNAPFFVANPPVLVAYTIIPWVGVMLLGYRIGFWFVNQPREAETFLLRSGILALVLFIALRSLNIYGDPLPWSVEDRGNIYTMLSFINVTKSPPSLLFLTVTLGIACLLLVWVTRLPSTVKSFFIVYGRVPFFFFILHLAVISATSFAWTYFSYGKGINLSFTPSKDWPPSYEPSLFRTYLIWLVLIIVLYYPCLLYGQYKVRSRSRWLSYL